MSIHVIPEFEKDQHVEDEGCKCEPELQVDKETGEMVWIHDFLSIDGLVDEIFNIT